MARCLAGSMSWWHTRPPQLLWRTTAFWLTAAAADCVAPRKTSQSTSVSRTYIHYLYFYMHTSSLSWYYRFHEPDEDFTAAGKKCATMGLISEQKGMECYMNIGLTMECAKIWNYDGIVRWEGVRHCLHARAERSQQRAASRLRFERLLAMRWEECRADVQHLCGSNEEALGPALWDRSLLQQYIAYWSCSLRQFQK